MKILKLLNNDSNITNNMYPLLFKKDLYYVTFKIKLHNIHINKFMSHNTLSIHLKDVAIFNDIDSAEQYAMNFINSSDIPEGDISSITIKHIVKGLCRKCGRSERNDNMLLCLPCSYT